MKRFAFLAAFATLAALTGCATTEPSTQRASVTGCNAINRCTTLRGEAVERRRIDSLTAAPAGSKATR